MPLHLLKLAVGVPSLAHLQARAANTKGEWNHLTRVTPKRAAELLDGGSLYWVVKGRIAGRQLLRRVETFTGADGSRCRLVLEARVVAVEGRPCRPFQGWRYLDHAAAPADQRGLGPEAEALPEELRRELASLGLL